MNELHRAIKNRKDEVISGVVLACQALIMSIESWGVAIAFGAMACGCIWIACRDQRKINRICAGMLDKALNGGSA